MTKVIHPTSPRAGTRAACTMQTSAHPTPTIDSAPRDPVARQAAIENALSMALYFVRQPGDVAANRWAATARANRALTSPDRAGVPLLPLPSTGNAAMLA